MGEEVIKRVTPQEVIDQFFSGHLRDYLAACARIKMAQKYNPEEFIAQRQGPQVKPGQLPSVVKLKAKEMIEEEKKTIRGNKYFLLAIEELEKELKLNSTPWRNK